MIDTNSIPDAATASRELQSYFDFLLSLSPEFLVFVFVLVISYFFRRISHVPNNAIWLCIVGGIITYPFLAAQRPDASGIQNAIFHIIIGTIISIIAAVSALTVHTKLFTKLAARWPMLSFLVCDETTESTQPTQPKP